MPNFLLVLCAIVFLPFIQVSKDKNRHQNRNDTEGDLSLWIDEQQVKMYSGFSMRIDTIYEGKVMDYILDPNLEKFIPTIPPELNYVNFTWKSGKKRYFYNFDRLQSFNKNILADPNITIKTEGKVPRRPAVFRVLLQCLKNESGIAAFSVGLMIQNKNGRPMPGTPIRVKMKKECSSRGQTIMVGEVTDPTSTGPDVECDKKCANGGWCNHEKICQCREGYMGQYCTIALCYPACMNNGTCIAPGMCSCEQGYQGRHCEGGICAERCQNGGKCIQKDTCHCNKGHYGPRCQFSKCIIACLNNGRCNGINKCKCQRNFRGDHCEIVQHRNVTCSKSCVHGYCIANEKCKCDSGWIGKRCNRRDYLMDEDEEDNSSYYGNT